MSDHHYTAEVRWERGNKVVFTENRDSRAHSWRFDGGVEVRASSLPQVAEKAFVAALSSGHMMSFLYVAARRGFRADSYFDAATGALGRNSAGKLAVTVACVRASIGAAGPAGP